MFGTHVIAPSSTFRGVSPNINEYSTSKQYFFPSHLFISHSLCNNLALGFGFTAPFGLGTKWDENWVGKYLAIETKLQIFTASPVIAWKPIDQLSFSAAFVYSFANVLITRKSSQTPFNGDAFIKLEGDDFSAFGYNLGLMFKPTDNITIGASYHSQVDYSFEGTATSTGAQQLIDTKRLPNGDVIAELTTPSNLAVGVAVDVTEKLKASLEFQAIGWSSYDSLKVNFVDAAYSDLASPRSYRDTYILRLGVNYKISNSITLLGGTYYDRSPVKTEYVNPSLPEGNRLGFSLGFDAQLSNVISIQASYLFIRSDEVIVTNSREEYTPGNTPFNGVYNSTANVGSLSLLFRL
jgi:long-chain fatty acid transport protein